mmetsp:Transcript_40979/g.72051  ORF Transcript_40979/g.72051 Transcript_40979/m.72051 type:complete len:310 (+) Transcript_40979:404-1333(+)
MRGRELKRCVRRVRRGLCEDASAHARLLLQGSAGKGAIHVHLPLCCLHGRHVLSLASLSSEMLNLFVACVDGAQRHGRDVPCIFLVLRPGQLVFVCIRKCIVVRRCWPSGSVEVTKGPASVSKDTDLVLGGRFPPVIEIRLVSLADDAIKCLRSCVKHATRFRRRTEKVAITGPHGAQCVDAFLRRAELLLPSTYAAHGAGHRRHAFGPPTGHTACSAGGAASSSGSPIGTWHVLQHHPQLVHLVAAAGFNEGHNLLLRHVKDVLEVPCDQSILLVVARTALSLHEKIQLLGGGHLRRPSPERPSQLWT